MKKGLAFAIYDLPLFGKLKMSYEDEFLIGIDRLSVSCTEEIGHRTRATDEFVRQLLEYLHQKRTHFDLPYKLYGTDFQLKVWSALRQIPYGQNCSYKDIAEALGYPKAFRAVGQANHKNPLPIIIPCHRVVSHNHKIGGYAWGEEIKQSLLSLEQDGTRDNFLICSDILTSDTK